MKYLVILGAGTGGALIANLAAKRLDSREWAITVVDRGGIHVYQPGLLFLRFRMYGYNDKSDVVRPIAAPLPKGVRLVEADVQLIDHAKKVVETIAGRQPYDFLVSAMGCRMAPRTSRGWPKRWGVACTRSTRSTARCRCADRWQPCPRAGW